MPAAGSKGGPKNPSELKDDTSSSREEKQVVLKKQPSTLYLWQVDPTYQICWFWLKCNNNIMEDV
jgi:hypothetical protein